MLLSLPVCQVFCIGSIVIDYTVQGKMKLIEPKLTKLSSTLHECGTVMVSVDPTK